MTSTTRNAIQQFAAELSALKVSSGASPSVLALEEHWLALQRRLLPDDELPQRPPRKSQHSTATRDFENEGGARPRGER